MTVEDFALGGSPLYSTTLGTVFDCRRPFEQYCVYAAGIVGTTCTISNLRLGLHLKRYFVTGDVTMRMAKSGLTLEQITLGRNWIVRQCVVKSLKGIGAPMLYLFLKWMSRPWAPPGVSS